MLFSSPIFLFLFLPVVLLSYFISPKFLKNIILTVASLFFYAWGEEQYILLLILCIVINYFFGLLIERYRDIKAKGRILLWISIASNLSLLLFYKYFNFIIDNINNALTYFYPTFRQINVDPIHLPIGISFFTFQALSYVIDVYRKEVNAAKNPLTLALYKSFFPQLIAGPIVRYKHIEKGLNNRSSTLNDFSVGVQRFIIGLGKKVIIANPMGLIADQIFSINAIDLTMSLTWLGVICYSLQIYYDFSGYSDMAIGLARMFGLRFLENFNYPYISRSIREFWQRWHISLSTWFRDYLYIPLGGNRNGAIRTYANLIIVFFLCGLWHGAKWSFVVWGLFHGAFLVIERTRFSKVLSVIPAFLQHSYTLILVMISWVFFRSDTLGYALSYLKSMIGMGIGTSKVFYASFYINPETAIIMLIGAIGSTPVLPFFLDNVFSKWNYINSRNTIKYTLLALSFVLLVVILLYSAMQLANGTYNPFIYFRF